MVNLHQKQAYNSSLWQRYLVTDRVFHHRNLSNQSKGAEDDGNEYETRETGPRS